MAGIKAVTKAQPCLICGKPDWCGRLMLQKGMGHYCHRCDDDVVPANGTVFILQRVTSGGFSLYQDKNDIDAARERWIDEQIALGKLSKNYREKHPVSGSLASYVAAAKNRPAEPGVKVLPDLDLASVAFRDKVYRCLLSQLTLEPWDEATLRKEWDNPRFPNGRVYDPLMGRYPIVSLPMEDAARIAGGWRLKNPLRKVIMKGIIKECGEPIGVPGFYYRASKEESAAFWEWFTQQAKTSNREVLAALKRHPEYSPEKWTMYSLSGIVFPVYDSSGNIIYLRIRDEHPQVAGEYNGFEGTFLFAKGGWYFRALDGSGHYSDPWPGKVVFNEREGVKLIDLGPDGHSLPVGKVLGKYKNFSSYTKYSSKEEKISRNRYVAGKQSGSHISLYCKDGDNMRTVYVVEGEKKAMVCNQIYGAPCISLPGVSCFSKLFENEEERGKSLLGELMERGLKLLILAYDADKEKNTAVLKAEASAVKAITSHGIRMMLAEWGIGYGKGIDDLLIAGVRANFTHVQVKD